jgi:hypothetical protein
MTKEQLETILQHLIIRYNNGLDYIRNNPDLSQPEVIEHFKILKDIRAIEEQLKKE